MTYFPSEIRQSHFLWWNGRNGGVNKRVSLIFEKIFKKGAFWPPMTSSSSNFRENCFFVFYNSRQKFWGTGSHTLGMKNSRPLRTGHDVINGPQMGQKLTNSNVWHPGLDLQWSWGSKNPEVEISQGPKASCALLDICTNFGLKWWKTGNFPRLWRHNVSKIKNFPKLSFSTNFYSKTLKNSPF